MLGCIYTIVHIIEADLYIYICKCICTHYTRVFMLPLQLAWTHITLIMFVSASHLIIQNVFEGVYWFLMPVSLVICNDIMAYVSGKHHELEK